MTRDPRQQPVLDPDPEPPADLASGYAPRAENQGPPPSGETAIVTSPPPSADVALTFERLAKDPTVSVENLERLMALWERNEARKAEAIFNQAMSTAQREMRPVAADAENPTTRSRYASYEALDRALRPIYTEHGFALSFNTGDAPNPEEVRVLCDVTHTGGHSRPYKLDMPADGKGPKGGDVMTKTHAAGSAITYGMRYLLKMIFNVAVSEDDDDGNSASARPAKPEKDAPAGFDEWLTELQSVADNGFAAFEALWGTKGPKQEAYRTHLMATAPKLLASIKTKARRRA